MLGYVTEIQTVKMLQMKILPTVIIESVIMKQSSLVKTVDVFLSYGLVILTTIVVMILMSPLISADKRIALLDGNVVPVEAITGVFQNGFSVMGKMIAVTTVMKIPPTVLNVMQLQTSNVLIVVVYQNGGCVILKMTVVITLMKPKHCAKAPTGLALNLNSSVPTAVAYLSITGAITTTIVLMVLMNWVALTSSARMERSNVPVATASLPISDVMEILTAVI